MNARRRYVSKRFDLCQSLEKRPLLGRRERPAEATRLDRLPQPNPFRVVGDVLDLVRDRARVDLLEPWQRLFQRLAGDREAQQTGRDARLQLGRERRVELSLVERRVAHRLRAEGIEVRIEMTVHAIRLDERHGRRDAGQELRIGRAAAMDGCAWSVADSTEEGVAATACSGAPLAPSPATDSTGAGATLSPSASNRARHAGSTASGLSRYCSRSWPT